MCFIKIIYLDENNIITGNNLIFDYLSTRTATVSTTSSELDVLTFHGGVLVNPLKLIDTFSATHKLNAGSG